MSSVTIDEVKRQKEDIFGEECREALTRVINTAGGQQARAKALQQLAVSEDSPFNLTSSARPSQCHTLTADEQFEQQLMEEKARLLREETEEIKRHLKLVKSHLNEFNLTGNDGDGCSNRHEKRLPSATGDRDEGAKETQQNLRNHEGDPYEQEATTTDRTISESAKLSIACNTRRPPAHDFTNDQQITSADSQFHRTMMGSSSPPSLGQHAGHTAPKMLYDDPGGRASDSTRFRPLTGKTDCPNCACDRRRSVCDKCISLQKNVVHLGSDQQQANPYDEQYDARKQPTLSTEQRINIPNSSSAMATAAATTTAGGSKQYHKDYDERPIRPAKKKLEDLLDEANFHPPVKHERAEVVDRVVVPNKLYTIGKSLNDKRTKLAQAIEDLQIMMDKVKKRGDRLEQERKIAKLYRDQWKFGPTIGGGSKSGSRESLRSTGASQYQSRFDPNLARDSKSLMGFQHIEPALKLRQYDNNQAAGIRQQLQSVPPKPKPRLSKMASNIRPTVVAFGSSNYRRPTEASVLHSRSKSLESLSPRQISTMSGQPKQQQKPIPSNKTSDSRAIKASGANFNNKSSSQLNLSSSVSKPDGDDSTPDQGVEEDLEEEIREDDLDSMRSENERAQLGGDDGGSMADSENHGMHKRSSGSDELPRGEAPRSTAGSPRDDGDDDGDDGDDDDDDDGEDGARANNLSRQPTRRTGGWVPVFGETEIKTINKRPAERKVLVLNGSLKVGNKKADDNFGQVKVQVSKRAIAMPAASSVGRSILRTGASVAAKPGTRMTTTSSARFGGAMNDRVLNEAKKKLQFANNLLEKEHLDSRTKNQVIVNKQRDTPSNRAQALRSQPTRTATRAAISNDSNIAFRSQQQQRKADPKSDWPENDRDLAANDMAQSLILGANKEISRLEAMISEQQRLLLRLTATADQGLSNCQHHSTSCQTMNPPPPPAGTSQHSSRSHHAGRQLISHLRDRLNKTKTRLARTLEEERAKHQQLEQRFDSSLRKQSDLENENEMLKQSLSKCIDTCLKDIMSTFEALGDHLNESASGMEVGSDITVALRQTNHQTSSIQAAGSTSAGPLQSTTSSTGPLLANAAQLIADNSHLRRMRSHIETIEQQRRGIFQELNQEKHKSQQLELELKQSKQELEQLIKAKRHLEAQLAASGKHTNTDEINGGGVGLNLATNSVIETSSDERLDKQVGANSPINTGEPSTSRQAAAAAALVMNKAGGGEPPVSDSSVTIDEPTASMTFSSIDLYRQYIQSMTPDLDAIRRERRMILDEFDNIKRMLSDMDT